MLKTRFLFPLTYWFLMVSQGRSDVVTEWNSLLLSAVRNESTSPPLAARNMAIVHLAIYDAVNAICAVNSPYFAQGPAPANISSEAAAVGAAYYSLINLYPSQQATFDAALGKWLGAAPEDSGRMDGFFWGRKVAEFILLIRTADGASTAVPYVPRTEPGAWRRTPPFYRPPDMPQWPGVTPFALTNAAQFRPTGPPGLSSARYSADLAMVQTLGRLNSTNRTPEQTEIARFWSDFSYTVTPPGHWNQIAQNVVESRGTTLAETAKLFALLNLAMADAGIAAWDAKYTYNSWRPVTAIWNADFDGNAETTPDPDWLPLLPSPSFPEYVSGHSTFSSAASTILGHFFGSDQIPFTVGSDALPGVLRHYSSFTAAAEEIGLSRIYGGIHFLSADLDGLNLGREIGDYVRLNFLLPVWKPITIETLGMSTNGVELTVQGSSPTPYTIEASGNLKDWVTLCTNLVPFSFQDSPSSSMRFYRAKELR